MAMTSTFLVQTFVIKRKRSVTGDREVALTESGVLKKVKALAGRMRDTTAPEITVEDETGGLRFATISGHFADLPEELAKSLHNM